MDYSKLDEIIVKTQEELDSIPLDFKGRIYIDFGTLDNRAIVKNRYYLNVIALENSIVEAMGTSIVDAMENSIVVAMENSIVYAWGNSIVSARENSSVYAWGNSTVYAWKNSRVIARGNAEVVDYSQGAKIKTHETAILF